MFDLPSYADLTMRPQGERWQSYKTAQVVSRIMSANAASAPDYPDLSKYENQIKVAIACSWLYTSWTKIQRGLGLVNFNVSTYSAEKKKGIVDHPIEQLFRKPNAFQSRTEFRDMWNGFLLINGNAYCYLNAPEPGGIPTELLILSPAYIRIVAGSDASHPVKGYVYTVSGVEIPLDVSEVIHRRFFNPRDAYYGLSPIEACALSAQADMGMAQWNRNFFTRDNATPAGLVNIKSMVSDPDYERIQREWRDAYGGTSRKTAFIRGADLSFEATGITQSDMDFINGRTFEKELIFSVYGIPPGSMAVNATEANANAAAETFTRETLWPLAIAEGEKWTAELAPLYGDNLIVEPEDFRVKDRKAELLEMQASGPYLEINEVREKYFSLPPVEWGDRPASGAQALPGGGMPSFGKPQIDATPQQIEQQDDGGKALQLGDGEPIEPQKERQFMTDDIIIPRVYVSRPMRKEIGQFEKYALKGKDIEAFTWRHTDPAIVLGLKALVDCDLTDLLDGDALKAVTLQNKQERKIASAMTAYFDGLTQRLTTGVKHVYSATKALPDKKAFTAYFSAAWWQNELKMLSGIMTPIMHDAVDDAAVKAADAVEIATGVSIDTSPFYKLASDWATKYTDTVLRDFNSMTQEGIGAIVARYTADPKATLDDLISAIQESRLVSADRAKTFAVTESTRAYAAGNYIAGDQIADNLGIDNNISQETVSDLCPAHPNCRCIVTPQIQYDDNDKAMGMDYLWQALGDEHVCDVCGPRNGKLLSEIASSDL